MYCNAPDAWQRSVVDEAPSAAVKVSGQSYESGSQWPTKNTFRNVTHYNSSLPKKYKSSKNVASAMANPINTKNRGY